MGETNLSESRKNTPSNPKQLPKILRRFDDTSLAAEFKTNWARNLEFAAPVISFPETISEVITIVRENTSVKAAGSFHSFSDIADAEQIQISLAKFDSITINEAQGLAPSVTVGAGVRYGPLAEVLHKAGYALENMASLPHITVVGSCCTGTHGSGVEHGCLSTAVRSLQMITADGEVLTLDRSHGDKFQAAVVGLGALGVVVSMTLDVLSDFNMVQEVYENLPLSAIEKHFQSIMAGGYSVSMFTTYQNDYVEQVWIKNVANEESRVNPDGADLVALGAVSAAKRLHPITSMSAEACTEQLGIPGPWHKRQPHFEIDFTPSSGEELQTEYFVSKEKALRALEIITSFKDRFKGLLQISEIRSIKADDLWMSPAYGRDSIAFHFTWHKMAEEVKALLPDLEAALKECDIRPHWGKLTSLKASDLKTVYPRFNDFVKVVKELDQQGKFRNAFLDRMIFNS